MSNDFEARLERLVQEGKYASKGAARRALEDAGDAAAVGIKLANDSIQYLAQKAREIAEREDRAREAWYAAGNPAGSFWVDRINAGMAGASPSLPNLAGSGASRFSWWRRALIRLAHSGH